MVLKGPRFRGSPVRTYVVLGSLAGAVLLVVGASSPSSGFVVMNGTFVDMPPGYRYLCTVPLSLFADPERILRRLYVFAEEPCKSTNATSEPCSPVFKEAQPRPSEHSNLEYHINNLNLYLYVFGLFSIFVIKPIQPDCDKIKGISVLLLETPLTRSKYFSPYTHAQRLTRTSGTFCTFAYKQTLHWWRI